MKCHRKNFKLAMFFGCLLLANGCLQWLVDSDQGLGWPHICIRNWQQFGFLALKGQLVSNPGGHDALQHPEVYAGHRAASLYLPFLVSSAFSWTGSNALVFHALLAAAVVLSVWRLLGGTAAALFAGALAVLSPGFVVEPTVLDPNAISELLAIPYAALLWWRLRQPQFTSGDFCLVVLLTILFSALNWTTALAHAQIVTALLAIKSVPRRRLSLYLIGGAVSGLFVLVLSVLSKTSGGPHQSGAFARFLAGYTWGRSGYAYDTNTSTLLLRFAFVNVVALFPVWLFLAWNWFREVKSDFTRALWSIAPILVALAEVLALRNYFCHHPWMGAPHMLLAAVLSLLILRSSTSLAERKIPEPITIRREMQAAAALTAVFAFSFAAVFFYREHGRSLLSLVSMIRANTARGDVLAMASAQDPRTPQLVNLLPEQLDRSILMIDSVPDLHHPAPTSLFLSPVPLNSGCTLVGQSAEGPFTLRPLLRRATEWYVRKVARRKPVEWLTLAETYYLYRVPQNLEAAAAAQSNHAR
jgi:hypothetical protein